MPKHIAAALVTLLMLQGCSGRLAPSTASMIAMPPSAQAQTSASGFVSCPSGFYWAGPWKPKTAYPPCAIVQSPDGYDWIMPSAGSSTTPPPPSSPWQMYSPAGKDGTPATVKIGKVTTLPAGSEATVVNVGTQNAALLDFGIPMGPPGFPPKGLTVNADGSWTLSVPLTAPSLSWNSGGATVLTGTDTSGTKRKCVITVAGTVGGLTCQ